MTKRKPNISPLLVGELFTDGRSYYTLIDCASEPSATVKNINTEVLTTKSISEFANLVQLKPVRPIEKPKKPRADKGGTHKMTNKEKLDIHLAQIHIPSEIAKEIADKTGDNLIIHVPTGLGKDTDYQVNIAGSEARGPTLRLTVMEALLPDDGKIPDCLSDFERKTIQDILDAGE